MTLNEHSVVALICHDCETDLRGAPKVQTGDTFLCQLCALRREQAARRAAATEHRQPTA